MEEGFDALLKKQVLRDEADIVLKKVFDSVWGEQISYMRDDKVTQDKKRSELEATLKELTTLIINSKTKASRDVYEKQFEELADEVALLGACSIENIDLGDSYRTALDKATVLLKSPYGVWQKLDVVEQHRLFYFIFDEKLPYDKNVGYRTDKTLTAVRLFEEFATANPLDVEMAGIEPACIRVT